MGPEPMVVAMEPGVNSIALQIKGIQFFFDINYQAKLWKIKHTSVMPVNGQLDSLNINAHITTQQGVHGPIPAVAITNLSVDMEASNFRILIDGKIPLPNVFQVKTWLIRQLNKFFEKESILNK